MGNDQRIGIRLHTIGHRPHHVALVVDVHVAVHHDHELEIEVRGHGCHDRVADLAVGALVQGDVAVEPAVARGRHVHGPGAGGHRLHRSEDRRLPGNGTHEPLLRVAGEDVLVKRLLPQRDAGDLRHVVVAHAHRMAGELAEGPLLLPHVGQDPPFQNHLRMGRDLDRHGLATHQRHRLLHHAADDVVFVHVEGRQRQGADGEGGMDPHDEGDVQGLAPVLGVALATPEMHARGQMHAQPVPLHHHGPVEAEVAHPAHGVPGDDDARGHVGCGADIEVGQQRNLAQVDVRPGAHHFLDGTVLDKLRRHGLAFPPAVLLHEVVGVHVQRHGQTAPSGVEVRDHGYREALYLVHVESGVAAGGLQLHEQAGDVVLGPHRLADVQQFLGAFVFQTVHE